MRMSLIAAACLALAACGQPAATAAATTEATDAAPAAQTGQQLAQATQAPAAGAPGVTAAQRRAAFQAAGLAPAPGGKVMNACDEAVTPSVHAANLGGALSNAVVLIVGGGPNSATCYGDGSLAVVLAPEGAGYRVVFTDQGGMLFSLPAQHNGVHDLMWGGPGFSFPSYRWNGTTYVQGASVPDTQPTLQSFN